MKKIWNKAPDTPLFYDLPTKGKAQRQSAGDVLQELDRRKLKARKRLYVAVWIVCILGLKVGIDMYGTNQERHKNEVTGIEEVKASGSEAEPMVYMLGDTEITYNGVNWEQVETGNSTGLNLRARRVIKGDSAEVCISTDIMQGIPIGTSLDTIKRSKKG